LDEIMADSRAGNDERFVLAAALGEAEDTGQLLTIADKHWRAAGAGLRPISCRIAAGELTTTIGT
jgi:hypothetical protein